MVLPVTGPINTSQIDPNLWEVGKVYWSKQAYKQAKPYDRPLAYYKWSTRCVGGGASSFATNDVWGGIDLGLDWQSTTLDSHGSTLRGVPRRGYTSAQDIDPATDRRLNRAREKFMGEVNRSVQLSVDILQYKEAHKMLVARSTQLGRAVKYFATHQYKRFFKELGISKPKNIDWRSITRDWASLWLEYSYGWKPLVQDIYDCMEVLSSPVGPLWISKSSKEDFDKSYSVTTSSGGTTKFLDNRMKLKIFARVSGLVSVTNPNLQVLKNAGLTNPLSWIWELIPFSFVVDWGVNVGKFIESLDETLGLTITNGSYSYGFTGSSRIFYMINQAPAQYAGYPGRRKGDNSWKIRSVSETTRVLGTPTAKLVRKPKILTNVDRGLNAASLLAQVFKPLKDTAAYRRNPGVG